MTDTTTSSNPAKRRWTKRRTVVATLLALIGIFFATTAESCSSSDYDQRKEQNKTQQVQGESQEQRNLKEKIKRDESSAGKIGYVYIMSFSKFVGYYTIKGKISDSGSQLAPEDDIVCRYNTGESCQTVDGPQDDNTYGTGDPGIFFFTTEGAMVVTSLDYLYSDQPIASAVDVPKLNPKQ